MKLAPKIIIIILGVFLITEAISGAIVQQHVSSVSEQSIQATEQQSAVQAMDKIDRFLYERTIDIRIMAASSGFSDLSNKSTAAQIAIYDRNLDYLRTFDGSWDSLSLLNAALRPVASTANHTPPPETADVVQARQQALAGNLAETDVIKDANGNPVQYFYGPVRSSSNQTVTGIIEGEISWPALLEITHNLKNDSIILVNSAGDEIGNNEQTQRDIFKVHFGDTAAYKQIQSSSEHIGTIKVANFDETANPLVTYAKEAGYLEYTGKDWRLITVVPYSKVVSATNQVGRSLSTSLAFMLLGGLIILLVFIEFQVIRPTRLLVSAVESITRGDWSRRVNIRSRDELGNLGQAFNVMATQLSLASRQIAEDKAKLEASINSLPLGFMLTDAKNAVVSLNPPMRQVVGLKHDSDIKQHKQMKLELLQKMLEQNAKTLTSGKATMQNYTTHDGRYLKLFFSPVLDGSVKLGVVTLVEDITEAKVLERSKDEFFSIASHELRTPLTAIRGNASLIRDYGKDLGKQDLNQMIGDIHESSTRLIEIVNDFLDASRLEQGKMEFKKDKIDVMEIIESVAYEMAAVMKERSLYLKTAQTSKSLPLVIADKDRVKQIIYNLTGNALKFTDKGGITISTEVVDKFLKISVTDTGRGIPADKQSLLFHKFQQAGDSIYTRDTTRGTGMGLYISKLLTEHMGGRLELEKSEVGIGTTFSFSLPLA